MKLLSLALALQPGLYFCPSDHDICDQQVKVYSAGSQITALKVEYVGDCGSMGPYFYPCSGNSCSDSNARFTLTKKNHYRWKNLGYPYECEMELKN